jgi:hypothetical protein
VSRNEPGRDIYREFVDAVNMSPGELQRWLETDESKAAGEHRGGGESIGHESGRKILRLLGRRRSELTESDYQHMQKVVAFVRRKTAQRPHGDLSRSRWRHSLMNWGHDPLR